MTAPVDFNFHGLAGIRLLDATSRDVAVVEGQIGPPQAPLAREPEIVIRFVDRLSISSRVRYLGRDDAGFTDDAFLILKGKQNTSARVQIPLDKVGKRCEFVCERGLAAIPLLIPILNLTVLGNGNLPLHASAFSYGGAGIVATGWSNGGKTEALLGFMANGADFIGDDWIYLSGDGKKMYGVQEPMQLWNWHLHQLPGFRRRIKSGDRARMRFLELVLGGMNGITSNGARHRFAFFKLINRMRKILHNQLFFEVPPHHLFSPEVCRLTGNLDKIFFVASHESPEVTARPADPREICGRMVFSLQQEQMDLLSSYWKFRFAFPEAANELIENSRELQRRILARVLEGKEVYEVYHPYPVQIPSLFDAMRKYCV